MTRVYIHSPLPPFERIAGPITPRGVSGMRLGLSIDSTADVDVATADIQLDWIAPGMCWVIEQPSIDEEIWGGFVDSQDLAMDSESIQVPLVGPKRGLLDTELGLRVPGRVSPGKAVELAIEVAQSRFGGIFPGEIDDTARSILIDVRGETISKFIETVAEISGLDWRERLVFLGQREAGRSNRLEFQLDFGLLRHETTIKLTREEIIAGIFSKSRLPVSVTEFGAAGRFADRRAATVSADSGALGSPAEPSDGVQHPESADLQQLVNERAIGPAAVVHVTEINERVERNVSALAEDRQAVLLRTVDEIVMTLDGTKAPVKALRVGDVVRLDVPQWALGLDVQTDVHIREIDPDDEGGSKNVIASVIHSRKIVDAVNF